MASLQFTSNSAWDSFQNKLVPVSLANQLSTESSSTAEVRCGKQRNVAMRRKCSGSWKAGQVSKPSSVRTAGSPGPLQRLQRSKSSKMWNWKITKKRFSAIGHLNRTAVANHLRQHGAPPGGEERPPWDRGDALSRWGGRWFQGQIWLGCSAKSVENGWNVVKLCGVHSRIWYFLEEESLRISRLFWNDNHRWKPHLAFQKWSKSEQR